MLGRAALSSGKWTARGMLVTPVLLGAEPHRQRLWPHSRHQSLCHWDFATEAAGIATL